MDHAGLGAADQEQVVAVGEVVVLQGEHLHLQPRRPGGRHRLLEGGPDLRLDHDALPLQRGQGRLAQGVRFGRLDDLVRQLGLRARGAADHPRAVLGRAGVHADMVEGPRQGNHAFGGDQPEGGLVAEHAAQGRGHAHRAQGVGAERRRA